MKWEFQAPDAAASLGMRDSFVAFLRCICTDDSDVEAAELIYGELVANVIRHAPGPIAISACVEENSRVRLDVCDAGRSFMFAPGLPAIGTESGRGLYLVWRLSERILYSRTERGNTVSVVLPVNCLAGNVGLPIEPERDATFSPARS